MIDLRQTKNYAQFLESIGWKTETLDLANSKVQVFIRKIPFLPFSFIKIQRPKSIDLKIIQNTVFHHRALVVKIEPDLNTLAGKNRIKNLVKFFQNAGFKQDQHPMLPTKTIWINLEKTEKQIYKNFKKDTRYCLKKAKNPPLQIIKSNDIEAFHRLLRDNCRLGRFFAFPLSHLKALKKTFKKNFLLFLALDKTPKPLAGAVTLYSPSAAYYYLAATSKRGRKFLGQYSIVWKAIQQAKKDKKKIFDLEGIYDQRFSQKSWLGFSHFKKSFGGKEVEYPGCFSKCFFKNLISMPHKLT